MFSINRTFRLSAGIAMAMSLGAIDSLAAQDRYMFGFTGGSTVTDLVTDQGTFGWSDRGWGRSDGVHGQSNDNYFTGRTFDGLLHRSFFLFDLESLGSAITTATLRVANPASGYNSPNPSELFVLSSVDPSWYDDMRVNQNSVAFYNALAGGTLFGTRSVSAGDNGIIVDFTLNAAAIAAINAAMGQEWALAGCINEVNCDRILEPPGNTIPEPATMTLLATGLAGMAAARRRKRA